MSSSEKSHESRNRISLVGPIVIAVICILIAVVRWSARLIDHQWANIATGFLILIAVGTLLVWWLRNVRSPLLRWSLPSALCLAGIAFFSLFKLVGVSGELVPQFRYRFASSVQLPSVQPTLDANRDESSVSVVLDERSFPGFLGAGRDGRIAERLFSRDWSASPPVLLWRQPIGAGLAGCAVAELRGSGEDDSLNLQVVVTLEQRESRECVTCYNLQDGSLLWEQGLETLHFNPLGDLGPRSTPMISDDGLVYALGATGHLWCIRLYNGAIVWEADLLQRAGIDQETSEKQVSWGRSASPLLLDGTVVVPLGGDSTSQDGAISLIAFDAHSGAEVWTAGNEQISYASPVVARLAGIDQVVSVNESNVAGYDLTTRKLLWSHPWEGSSSGGASCSNPTIVSENRVLISKGYGGGGALLQVNAVDDGFAVDELWHNRLVLKTKFTNPIVDGQYVYGLSDGTLECVEIETGTSKWKQSRRSRFGHGHILVVEDVILATTEDGQVVLVELTPDEYVELGRFQAIEGKTWNPCAVAGTKVLVRNGTEVALWELGRR